LVVLEYILNFFSVCIQYTCFYVVLCRKRSSKWDRPPESDDKPASTQKAGPVPAKREKRSTKSKWDKLPDESKWDKGPSESKWDVRPEDVAEQDHTSVADSQEATSVAGTCGMAAAAEAAARVNAMLMAKGTLKAAEPLLVNATVLKSKPTVSSVLFCSINQSKKNSKQR